MLQLDVDEAEVDVGVGRRHRRLLRRRESLEKRRGTFLPIVDPDKVDVVDVVVVDDVTERG